MASYTAAQFIKAIPGSGGIITVIADRVGCDWATAKRYITNYSTVEQAYNNERNRIVDLAETKIISAINEGDIQTVKWYLSTIGKERGYTERQEHDVSGVSVQIVGIDPDGEI